jgi:hypothetical protein
MPSIREPSLVETGGGLRAARLGELAGCDRLGMSLYELGPGEEMVFHYHVQREELLIVLGSASSTRACERTGASARASLSTTPPASTAAAGPRSFHPRPGRDTSGSGRFGAAASLLGSAPPANRERRAAWL